jgi:hypothetical protein
MAAARQAKAWRMAVIVARKIAWQRRKRGMKVMAKAKNNNNNVIMANNVSKIKT